MHQSATYSLENIPEALNSILDFPHILNSFLFLFLINLILFLRQQPHSINAVLTNIICVDCYQ